MYDSVVKLAKSLSTDDIRTKVLRSRTMKGRRVLYDTDYGQSQYGMCFYTDGKKADYSYIHIRIFSPGEFKYEEVISRQVRNSDALMASLGKEIES